MNSPFTLEVYDKTLSLLGTVGNPRSLTWTPRHNKAHDLTFELDSDHPRTGDLLTEGSRVGLRYDGQAGTACSGMVRQSHVTADGLAAFTVLDDFTLGNRVLAWVRPDQSLASQDTGTYDLAGPAETVAKTVLGANFRRLGLPVLIAPDLGRGAAVAGSWRMEPVFDKLLPLLEQGGLGLTIRQAPAAPVPTGGMRSPGLRVEVYAPRRITRTLTYRGGTVLDWGYLKTLFKGSRWVLGAQRTDPTNPATRVWAQDIDDIAESHWGPLAISEVFLDSPSINVAIVSAQAALTQVRQSLSTAETAWADHSALDSALDALRASQITFQAARTPSNQDALNAAQVRYNTAIQDTLAKQATLGFQKAALDSAVAATVVAAGVSDQALYDAFQQARLTQGASDALSVTIDQTSSFPYGDAGCRVGDLLTIQVGLNAPITELLSEATFTWTAASGLVINPVVGDYPDPTRDLARFLGDLTRANRTRQVE